MSLRKALTEDSEDDQSRPIRVRSPYTGKVRMMPGYLVDYEENDAEEIDKPQILKKGSGWNYTGMRNQATGEIPKDQSTEPTVVNKTWTVTDYDAERD